MSERKCHFCGKRNKLKRIRLPNLTFDIWMCLRHRREIGR